MINRAGKFICLRACLLKRDRACVTDKPALSSSKIGNYEYLAVEEILPSGPSQMIEQAKVTYYSVRKAVEK